MLTCTVFPSRRRINCASEEKKQIAIDSIIELIVHLIVSGNFAQFTQFNQYSRAVQTMKSFVVSVRTCNWLAWPVRVNNPRDEKQTWCHRCWTWKSDRFVWAFKGFCGVFNSSWACSDLFTQWKASNKIVLLFCCAMIYGLVCSSVISSWARFPGSKCHKIFLCLSTGYHFDCRENRLQQRLEVAWPRNQTARNCTSNIFA